MDCGLQAGDMNLPPGFRFHPTDEELITHYLVPKIAGSSSAGAVIEVDFHKFEPWELPSSGKLGEEWYFFFCVRDRKYPTGLRTNRATDSGFWKATGKDKEVRRRKSLIGMKKSLVFYRRTPNGEKTDWVMQEYRIEGDYRSKLDNAWVICRVFCRRSSGEKKDMETVEPRPSWFGDELDFGVLLPCGDEEQNKNKSFSVPDTVHMAYFPNCLVGVDVSEELANCYDSALLTDGHLHCQGDSSIKLFQDYDQGSGKEALISNFNHRVFLSDADALLSCN